MATSDRRAVVQALGEGRLLVLSVDGAEHLAGTYMLIPEPSPAASTASTAEPLREYAHCLHLEIWLVSQPDFRAGEHDPVGILDGFECPSGHSRHMVQSYPGINGGKFMFFGRK